jgi:restriction system protein
LSGKALNWIKSKSRKLKNFKVSHLKKLRGYGGEYEFDIVAEFEELGGALYVTLIECKYYKNPVKRDVVMLLDAKKQDVGAHKGIVYTTSSFQRGALVYAKAHGIATAIFRDGRATYETKSSEPNSGQPAWHPNHKYVGYMVGINESGNEAHHLIADDYHDAIEEWFRDGEA